jgi:hypothetical protein
MMKEYIKVAATTNNEQESTTVLIWNINSHTELRNIPYAQKLPPAPKPFCNNCVKLGRKPLEKEASFCFASDRIKC